MLENLSAPRQSFFLQARERHHAIDEPHVERLPRVVLLAQKPNLARLLLAHDAREIRGAVAPVEASDLGSGLPETRVFGRDRQIAHQVQDMPAANCVTGDHRNHGLGECPDLALQIEHIQTRHAVGADIASVAAHSLVATRTKRFVAGAGQDHHAHC